MVFYVPLTFIRKDLRMISNNDPARAFFGCGDHGISSVRVDENAPIGLARSFVPSRKLLGDAPAFAVFQRPNQTADICLYGLSAIRISIPSFDFLGRN